MFKTLCKTWYGDEFEGGDAYPFRSYMIDAYKKMYSGTFYDVLKYDFNTESDGDAQPYIPISWRIPCVQTNLARVVVDETVSIVFGEQHCPRLQVNDDEKTHKFSTSLIQTCKLNKIMQEAMTIGAAGSVAIFVVLVDGKPHFYPQSTEGLTPIYDPKDPRRLVKIIERAKVKTADLNRNHGYSLSQDYAEYWIYRELNETSHLTYHPIPVAGSHLIDDSKIKEYGEYKFRSGENVQTELRAAEDYNIDRQYNVLNKVTPSVDKRRSIDHNFGFCPAVWIKNLPTMNNWDIDGACTFGPACESLITLDYTLSQAYRSLKYSSEPVLMVKDPSGAMPKKMSKAANKVLMLGKDADAKWLEINGTAASASLDYAKYLREIVLESVSGNRVSPEKIHAAQSGKAMELMNQPMIWLAEKLRSSYGEFGLVKLIELVIKMNQETPIKLRDGLYPVAYSDPSWTVLLDWPDWYEPTGSDLMQEANALNVLHNAGIISKETALRSQASNYNVQNIQEEIEKAQSEAEQFDAQLKPQVQEKITV